MDLSGLTGRRGLIEYSADDDDADGHYLTFIFPFSRGSLPVFAPLFQAIEVSVTSNACDVNPPIFPI